MCSWTEFLMSLGTGHGSLWNKWLSPRLRDWSGQEIIVETFAQFWAGGDIAYLVTQVLKVWRWRWSPWPRGWFSYSGVNICWVGPRVDSHSLGWVDVRSHFHFTQGRIFVWFGPRGDSRCLGWMDVRFHFHFTQGWIFVLVVIHALLMLGLTFTLWRFKYRVKIITLFTPRGVLWSGWKSWNSCVKFDRVWGLAWICLSVEEYEIAVVLPIKVPDVQLDLPVSVQLVSPLE